MPLTLWQDIFGCYSFQDKTFVLEYGNLPLLKIEVHTNLRGQQSYVDPPR